MNTARCTIVSSNFSPRGKLISHLTGQLLCENYISAKLGQIPLTQNSLQELASNFPLGEIFDCCSTPCNLHEGHKSRDIS